MWSRLFLSRFWVRFGWLCPLLAFAVGVAVIANWGLHPWTTIVAALLLICPALLIWGAFRVKRISR